MAQVRTRTDERAAQLSACLEDPDFVGFLPAIYLAWADGDLTEAEIAEVRAKIQHRPQVSAAAREHLGLWLDPSQPPNSRDLDRLRRRLEEGPIELDPADRQALQEIGVEVEGAPAETGAGADRAALVDLVSSVGGFGRDMLRLLPLPDLRSSEEAAPDDPLATQLDVGTLHDLLEPDHRELRARVQRLLIDEGVRRQPGWTRAEHRAAVLRWCRRLGEEGIGNLAFPVEHGGQGDLDAFLTAFRTLAYGDLSLVVKYGVQFGLFGGSLHRLGTQRHHDQWLREAGTADVLGCFAMTETGHGSDVQSLGTVAVYDAETGDFVLDTPDEHARKDYIGNALHGRLAVVFAQLEVDGRGHGVHAFLVPLRDEEGALLPGIEVEDCGEKVGLNGVDNGRIAFHQVRVERNALLDEFAAVDEHGEYSSPIASDGRRFFTMIGTLVHGRVAIANAAVSAAKTALAVAVRYGDRRRQFGPEPGVLLLDYPSHQRRLLPLLADTYALHFALRHLVATDVAVTDDPDAGERRTRALEGLAAGLKAASTWHATATIQECREACGGQGYLSENRFGDLKADTEVFTTFEGDNTVLLQLVAKGLLTDYRQQFEDMDLMKALRLFASRAGDLLGDANLLAGRSTDTEHLRDRDFHLDAFREREDHMTAALGRRLKARMDDGMDPALAFLSVQPHVLATARAHVERVVLEQLAAAVDACSDPALVAVLGAVCDLHALARLEADRGWFLEHGQFAPAKAKAITREVTALCAELRPHAVDLVDAFGIPDELLAAPIAT
jgi:acyl-CoA oxidase